MNEVAANDDLQSLTNESNHTEDFINDKLKVTMNAINECLNSLGEDVFQGPAADSCKKGLEMFIDAIKNPIVVNFENVSTALTNTQQMSVAADSYVGQGITSVYQENDFSSGSEDVSHTPIEGGTNRAKILNFLLDKGFNEAAAAGIIANMNAESGCNPKAYNANDNGGPSYGLCQWHNTRYYNLQNFCKRNDLDYTSIEGQMEFLMYELKNSYGAVYSYIKGVENSAQGAYNAAYKWTTDFEVCYDRFNVGVTRGNAAKSIYNSIKSA